MSGSAGCHSLTGDDAVVRGIVRLGLDLGLTVTAEGIETAEQLTELRRLRCRYGKGYYFSSAVDAADLPGRT